jgi:hypothetical protein
MKPTSLFLASLALCLPALPFPPTASLARLIRAEDTSPEFREKFKKAMQTGSKAETQKLVKAEPEPAIELAIACGEKLLGQPTDEDKAMLKELGDAWKAVSKSEFVRKIEEYYSTLEGQKKKDRQELKERFVAAQRELEGDLSTKEGLALANLTDEIEILAAGFEEVGDDFWCGRAWSAYASLYDEELRGPSADLPRARKGYQNAVDAYVRIELKDKDQAHAAKRLAALAATKTQEPKPPPPPPDKDAPAAPGLDANASSGAAIVVPLTFDVLPAVDAYQRPCYECDEVYQIWSAVGLKAKGSSGNFPYYDAAPVVVRVGSSDVRLDLDRDGQGDEKLPLTNTLVPFKCAFQVNGVPRQWAFFAMTGIEKDNYQGIEVNLAPTDGQMTIYTLSAASVVGTVEGTPVRILDDFPDGNYTTRPQTWGNPGLTRDNFQPEMDSIVIGASKRARPWSDVQEIGGKWYRLEVNTEGTELKATPMTPPTGVLKLAYKGGTAPAWVVVKNMAEGQHLYFDLVEGGAKGVNVPVGNYQLFYGEVRKGKKRQIEKLVILPSKTPPMYSVKSGETTVVELGAPYGFDFRLVKDGEKVTVEGQTVAIVGAKGERYERPWNCVPKPEVSWRKKGTKNGTKADHMKLVLDSQSITDHGWPAAWLPLDFSFEARGAGEGVEVQLVDKKHDLLGKIESEWKE